MIKDDERDVRMIREELEWWEILRMMIKKKNKK